MKRVLVAQPSLDPPGGGNAVAARAIEALAPDHDVTLLVWRRPDLQRVDRYYGTGLAKLNVKIVEASTGPLRIALGMTGLRGALLERHVIFRRIRSIADQFDVIVSTSNEIDAGRPAIQYIHYPWAVWPRPDYDLQWFHRVPGVLRAYYGLAHRIAPSSRESIGRNLTLVNSAWTGALYEHYYHAPWSVLHPPVAGDWMPQPWEHRDDAFAIVGRISREKEVERAIEIVGALRQRMTLRVIGTVDDGPYYRRLRRMSPSWVEYHLDLDRRDLLALLGRTRYGIHCMAEEHFGIAIAEMMSSGCIPFVRAGGGAPEIVSDARLTYTSSADAVARIEDVLHDQNLRDTLREHCSLRAARFSVEGFQRGIRQAVASSGRGAQTIPPTNHAAVTRT